MIYIFDLDGTLADCEHRRHWLDKDQHPELTSDERWARFFDPGEIAKDSLNWPVKALLDALVNVKETIWIWSARPERLRKETELWLRIKTIPVAGAWHEPSYDEEAHLALRMRPAGCFVPDHLLKEHWLRALPPGYLEAINGVFDDRQSVVDMWRRNGIPCFQVAPGNF